jgi:putative hemolysin
MSSILIPILAALVLILALGHLSLAEVAIASARRSRLKQEAARGKPGAPFALALTADPQRTIAVIRLAATFARMLLGAYVGVLLCRLADSTSTSGAGFVALAIVAILGVTVAAFILGELIPSRLALQHPERTLRWLARPLSLLTSMLGPLARRLQGAADHVSILLGVRASNRPTVDPEEIRRLLWEGTKAGVFEPVEFEIFKRVFRYFDRRAKALMTPRDQIVWIDLADSPEEIRRKVIGSPHSRFPVCDESLDNLLGVVQVKDLLAQSAEGLPLRVKGVLTLPSFVYEGSRGPQILEILKKSATHTAVVLDEFGSVVGLLTINDILRALIGELPAGAGEDDEARVVQRADGSWLIDGRFPLDEFRELFELRELPEGDFHTVGGLVVTQLGHIPAVAEKFQLLGLQFEIVDMDANRVDRVLVSHHADGKAGPAAAEPPSRS